MACCVSLQCIVRLGEHKDWESAFMPQAVQDFESQLVCVLQSQQCLSFVCLCLSLEQQSVLFLVTGLDVAQAAALLSVLC